MTTVNIPGVPLGSLPLSLNITRAEIASNVVPFAAIAVSGTTNPGDAGAGAVYVRGTSSGPNAIQDAAGIWFEEAIPPPGTAAAEDVGYFATAAQGGRADTAVQPGLLGFTRDDITTKTISLPAFIVSGEATAGDTGAGASYVSGTSTGPRAIQDASGAWFQRAYAGENAVPLGRFGKPTIGGDWTLVMESAIASGEPILLPLGTTLVEQVVVLATTFIQGRHRELSTLKLADGSNTHVVQTENVDALVGTDPTSIAPYGVILRDFSLDGNSANNSSGCGIKVFARRMLFQNLYVHHVADDGLYSDYSDTAGGTPDGSPSEILGMEGIFRDITFDIIGGNGVLMGGPHDSAMENIIAMRCSQKAANTYDGFHFLSGMTGRMRNLHAWSYNLSSGYVPHRYAILDEAGGLEITASHFEGSATANAYFKAANTTVSDTLFYATRNAARNLIIGAPKVRVSGRLLDPAADSTTTRPVGLTMGLSGDYPTECVVDLSVSVQDAGTLDLTHSAGKNIITMRGAQGGANPVVIGNPQASDAIDIYVDNTRYLTRGVIGTNNITAGGTGASDATDLNIGANRVTATSGNDGVKLPPVSKFLGETSAVVVTNSTGGSIKVYANTGDFIDGTGFSYLPLPAGKTASFSSAAATQCAAVVSA